MTMYLIEPDFNYLELDLDPTDLEEYFPQEFDLSEILDFSRQNLSLAHFWPALSTGFVDTGENRKIPDISIWLDGVLLLSPTAKLYAAAFFKTYGEFLPILIEGEEWSLFNCLTTAELARKPASPTKLEFARHSVGNKLLFKCNDADYFGLYCQDKFKQFVAEYNLAGIRFETELKQLPGESSLALEVVE